MRDGAASRRRFLIYREAADYGITAVTWLEKGLSTPTESTAVTT